MCAQRAPLAQDRHVVVHVDIDAFFVQVEQQRDPSLRNRAVAVQQHGDIIAMNAAAKAAGVRKHCPPDEARRLLREVGGKVAHVFVEEGYRISYRPYREMSALFHKLLRAQDEITAWQGVIEKASIDEAFILLPSQHGDPVPVALGISLGERIRKRAFAELGLRVSVGVARNCFLAKQASSKSKPDGLGAIEGHAAVQSTLEATAVERIPGYGGKVAQALRKHGVATAVGVQALSASALQTLCELPPESAQTLLHLAHGRDDRVPAPKPPPQTISLQMTLTPVPVAMHPSWRGDGAAHAVAGSKDGMLQPLLLGGEGSHERMCALLHVMLRDLLVRVVKDSEEEGRWPTSLLLRLRTNGAAGKVWNRASRFPSRSTPPDDTSSVGTSGATDDAAARRRDASAPSDHNLDGSQAAVLRLMIRACTTMFQDITVSQRGNLPVVQVHVGATKHVSIDSASVDSVATLFKRHRAAQGGAEPIATKRQTDDRGNDALRPDLKRARAREESADFEGVPQVAHAEAHEPALAAEDIPPTTVGAAAHRTTRDVPREVGPEHAAELEDAPDAGRLSSMRKLELSDCVGGPASSAQTGQGEARGVDMLQVLSAFDEGELGLDEISVLAAAMHKSVGRM